MAGEIEEPVRLDFQAESLHSGSISFGRFETEALCWERRSSFQHNSYLEEVEKCSKPGLVTEKKAYFEAHFRKKGIMCMSPSKNHNETKYETTENDNSEKTGYHEEISHMKTGIYFPCFDESPDGAVPEREHGLIGGEEEVFGTSTSEAQIVLSCDSVENAECIPKHGKVEESHHAKLGSSLPDHSGSGIEMERNLDGETANLDANDVSDVAVVLFSDSLATMENSNASPEDYQQVSTSKEKFSSEAECMKQRSEPQVGVAQSRRCVSSAASKVSENKPSKVVKPERKSSQDSAQDKCPLKKTAKSALGSKTKGVKEIKRGVTESRNRRITEPQSSTLQKVSSRVYQSANRVNPAAGTTKPCTKQDNSRLTLKYNEQAGRRKESVMKLEQKAHVREAEVHQHQTKTLEKTKAEIKQLRKSLNFKAKPLPSLYQGDLCDSHGNKALGSSLQPGKLRSRSSNIGSRVAEKSLSSSPAGKHRAALFIHNPPKTADPPQASGGTSCNSMVTSDSIPSSPAAEISNAMVLDQ